MKKFTAIITICIILITMFVPAAASQNEDASRSVLALIKPNIPDTNVYDNFESGIRTGSGVTLYYFNWSYSSKDGEVFRSMDITATAEGIITSYSRYDSTKNKSSSSKPTINRMTSDQALAKTQVLADNLNPMLKGKIELIKYNDYESLVSDGYSFRMQRCENGIPVYGNTGYISVDADAENIVNYNINYTPDLDFPDMSNAISLEDAKTLYSKKIGMTPVYKTKREEGKISAYIAYTPGEKGVYINALNGDAVVPIVSGFYTNNKFMDKEESVSDSSNGASNRFSEAELKELEAIENLIGITEAETLLRGNEIINLADDMKLEAYGVYKNYEEKYIYYLTFSSTDGISYADISLNAETGNIYSFYISSDHKKYDPDNKADATTAKEYVQKLAPLYYKSDDSGEYRFKEQNENSFAFVRFINDIAYEENFINITLSPDTHTPISYSFSRTECQFPSPSGIITDDQACTALFDQVSYSVYYYPSCSDESMSACDVAIPVYMTDPQKDTLIYADTGKLVYEYNEPKIGLYTDIDGHYAEEIIHTLSKYAIGFEGEVFNPDAIITQQDYIALLTSVVYRNDSIILYSDYDYTSSYRRANDIGILKEGEKSPDCAITRETAAVYLIRAIGLDEVASLDGIYLSAYSDVTENIGHISILTAMGVIGGYNGMYNPDKALTRADAMIMIYNYLSR